MKVSGNIANLQARLEDKCQNSCHKSIGSNLIAYHSCTLFCSFVERHHLLDFQSWTRLLLEAIHQIGMGFVGGQNRPKWRSLIRGCCNLILPQTDPCLFNGLDPSLMSIFELRLKGSNYIKQCTPCFMVLVDISCPPLYLYFSNNVLVLSQGSIYKPKNAIIRCVSLMKQALFQQKLHWWPIAQVHKGTHLRGKKYSFQNAKNMVKAAFVLAISQLLTGLVVCAIVLWGCP